MQAGLHNDFLMTQAAEVRVRDSILKWYLKLFTNGKLLVASFVAIFFLYRVMAINTPGERVRRLSTLPRDNHVSVDPCAGYSQCSPMLEYGQWEGARWNSVVCIPGYYQSKEYGTHICLYLSLCQECHHVTVVICHAAVPLLSHCHSFNI